MKKFGYILFSVLFMAVCVLPALAMPLGGKSASPPALYTAEEGVNGAFGEEMESWLTENFAGRKQLVTLNARLTQAVFATSAERQVIIGKDGWLFYDQTLEDYLGTSPLTEQEQNDIAVTMALVQEYAREQGSDFLFTAVPNKNSLYGEYMPYYTVPAQAENDLVALAAAMQAQGVEYVDLYALLNGRPGLYHKRDTHWNNAGARLAYDEMLTALGQPHQSFDVDCTIAETWPGDLDRLIFPVNGVPDEQVIYDPAPEAFFDYVGPARVDIARVTTKSEGGQGSLLCFRDSFGNALIPFFSTAYADATYVSATPHTPDLLQPGQTLVIEIVQRNLRTLLTAAPRMPAPKRELSGLRRRADDGKNMLFSEEKDGYLHVYGTVGEEAGGRLYLAVESGGETVFYEAFPAREQALLQPEADGRGFSLYIPREELPAGEFKLFPVVQFENEGIIIEVQN